MDPAGMDLAQDFAEADHLARALLVVKDGFLVHEAYFGEGGREVSTNLWSVTKSFTSALAGMVKDRGLFESTSLFMRDLMPAYPEFDDIRLQHVLTMTTGLNWAEEGPLWVKWIFSDDWVSEALSRGQRLEPGEEFYYSSGNSHFLSAMIRQLTGYSPGKLAKEALFDPLGIDFDTLDQAIEYQRWEEYLLPLPQSWRRDPQGNETASFGLYLTARDMAKFGFLYLNQGFWDGEQIISRDWIRESTRDQETNIYGRYSYGYQWYITLVDGHPSFLASGYGGQIIGVVPELDLVVVLKYEAEDPRDPESGTAHDDMQLFELVVEAVSP